MCPSRSAVGVSSQQGNSRGRSCLSCGETIFPWEETSSQSQEPNSFHSWSGEAEVGGNREERAERREEAGRSRVQGGSKKEEGAGRRQEGAGRRPEAGGRRKEEGGRKREEGRAVLTEIPLEGSCLRAHRPQAP